MSKEYEELKKEVEELKDFVYKFKRDYEDVIYNLDESNFTDEFRAKMTAE